MVGLVKKIFLGEKFFCQKLAELDPKNHFWRKNFFMKKKNFSWKKIFLTLAEGSLARGSRGGGLDLVTSAQLEGSRILGSRKNTYLLIFCPLQDEGSNSAQFVWEVFRPERYTKTLFGMNIGWKVSFSKISSKFPQTDSITFSILVL